MTDHDSVDNFFNDQLYSWNRLVLLIIGTWPYQNYKWRLIISFIILSGLSFFTLQQVTLLLEELRHNDGLIKFIHLLLVSYRTYVAVIGSIFNFNLMKQMTGHMRSNWIQLKNLNENTIFLQYAKEGKSSTLVHFGLGSLIVIMYTLQNFITKLFHMLFIENEYTTEYHLEKHVFNAQSYVEQCDYCILYYLLNMLAAVFIMFIHLGLDLFFIMNIYHACGMFATLRYRIDMAGQNYTKINRRSPKEDREKILLEQIVQCIQYHNDCIRFSELIENLWSLSWLLQITSLVVSMCILAIEAIIKTNESGKIFTNGIGAVFSAARIFHISLASQKMSDHSDQIHQSIYDLSWYELPPKVKKLLIPMLLRASKPCEITIGKMMPLNLNSFCSLMKVSVSYFTFIHSTQ